MGSPGVAAWIAHVAFWVLVGLGWMSEEIGTRTTVALVAFWFTARALLPMLPYGAAWFSPLVAGVTVVLVFVIFKGDVRMN